MYAYNGFFLFFSVCSNGGNPLVGKEVVPIGDEPSLSCIDLFSVEGNLVEELCSPLSDTIVAIVSAMPEGNRSIVKHKSFFLRSARNIRAKFGQEETKKIGFLKAQIPSTSRYSRKLSPTPQVYLNRIIL